MMRFSTDHYFHIGSTHYLSGKPNQDYALSSVHGTTACAVVSDGCSTGRNTDIGSRIQALSLTAALEVLGDNFFSVPEDVIEIVRTEKRRRSRRAEDAMGLSTSDMLATSLYAFLSQLGGFVHLEGDGVVARKYKDGRILAFSYDWLGNTPFYPAYRDLGLVNFVEAHGGNLDDHRLVRTEVIIEADGTLGSVSLQELTLHHGIKGVTDMVDAEELEELEFVAVFSDGITQIEGVEWPDAVHEFMAFKSLGGEFAKRRMIRGLKNYERNGHKPLDDISVAVIRIETTDQEVSHVVSNVEGES